MGNSEEFIDDAILIKKLDERRLCMSNNQGSLGDQKVQLFLELYTANERRIRTYVLSLVPNFNDTDDIMQEISKKLWSKFGEFQLGTDFLAWAIRIAHYRILEYRRQQRKKGLLLDEQVLDSISCDAEKYSRNLPPITNYLYQCLNKLPVNDRKLLRLKYEEDLKTKEISTRTGKTIHSIYKHIAKLHEVLLFCIKRSLAQEQHL